MVTRFLEILTCLMLACSLSMIQAACDMPEGEVDVATDSESENGEGVEDSNEDETAMHNEEFAAFKLQLIEFLEVNPRLDGTPFAERALAVIEQDGWNWDEDGPPSFSRLAGNPRYAVVLEAFYALSQSHNGSSNKRYQTGSYVWTASDWNYLASDLNAYNRLINDWYHGYASVIPLFYSNVWAYGLYNGYGRGGQCMYFSNLLVFRSGTDSRYFPGYSSLPKNKSARCAQRGDVIFRWSGGPNGHVAVVVAILAGNSSNCTVSAVDVVDSNQPNNEYILRHIINTSGTYFGEDLDKFYVHTGVSYYNTPYAEW